MPPAQVPRAILGRAADLLETRPPFYDLTDGSTIIPDDLREPPTAPSGSKAI